MLLCSAPQRRHGRERPVTEHGLDIHPVPTEEEAAAIVAALESAWPRAAVDEPAGSAPRWRFSGRWWTKPVPSGRARP